MARVVVNRVNVRQSLKKCVGRSNIRKGSGGRHYRCNRLERQLSA